ncbi:MAG: molybdenum cofactor synthesis domain-containing protein [Dethiobacteria bacterium]|jgi:molybdenum cofactor synthesis domain-containing protein|nr:molybdopterin-binding protein [Bacillota bacterium]NMD34095.1 molybdenum cofactor biosynthesis protein [Bacillota bacterium]HOB29550.1 molybdopterin-binding protein [Bacillota bacterium]HPZ42089.1 molybdopterin-binding protein [Bacillota bacterium]HQD52237.1 molybdopterin-binding protein [Bacillota bacterium]
MGEIIAVCISAKRGERKKDIGEGILLKDSGLERDGHSGFAHRQVSLLAIESIEKMRAKGLDVGPGDFAENLTTRGIDLVHLPIGTRLQAGPEAILRVTQIGKECHDRCAIYAQAGDCVMPREGIFAEVLKGGKISSGDRLQVRPNYRFATITVSDKGAAGEREDRSGPLLSELLQPWGDLAHSVIIPDERAALVAELRRMVVDGTDAVFTSGGTGLSPHDITPEATLEVVERLVPGLAEAMRRESFSATPRAMLSRAVAGISGQTLIVNLPGSPRAVRECFAVLEPVLDHALETLTGRGGECGAE